MRQFLNATPRLYSTSTVRLQQLQQLYSSYSSYSSHTNTPFRMYPVHVPCIVRFGVLYVRSGSWHICALRIGSPYTYVRYGAIVGWSSGRRTHTYVRGRLSMVCICMCTWTWTWTWT
eukprot:5964459-Prymnesium_polylepis.1